MILTSRKLYFTRLSNLTKATKSHQLWSSTPTVSFPNSKVVQTGRLHRIDADPAKLIPQSDIVLWTGPVHATKAMFEKIRPHVNLEKTFVGTIFAQGLVHVSALRIFGKRVKFFALRNIPWLCRCVEKGGLSCVERRVDILKRTLEFSS